jgi:hypothetical protein
MERFMSKIVKLIFLIRHILYDPFQQNKENRKISLGKILCFNQYIQC